jgi:hypothetical protein
MRGAVQERVGRVAVELDVRHERMFAKRSDKPPGTPPPRKHLEYRSKVPACCPSYAAASLTEWRARGAAFPDCR